MDRVFFVERHQERPRKILIRRAVANSQAPAVIRIREAKACLLSAVGNDDLMNVKIASGDFKWKGDSALGYTVAILLNVAFRALRGFNLLVDGLPLPTSPSEQHVLAHCIKLAAFTVEKQEDMIFEHRQNIAKFLDI